MNIKEIICKKCGNSVRLITGSNAFDCPHCGNALSVEEAVERSIVAPSVVFAFPKSESEGRTCLENLKKKYGVFSSKRSLIDEYLRGKLPCKITRLYLPYHMVVFKYEGSYSAISGVRRYKKSTQTHSIAWTPISGNTSGQVSFVFPAFDLSGYAIEDTFFNDKLIKATYSDLRSLEYSAYTDGALFETAVEAFSVADKESLNRVFAGEETIKINEAIQRAIPGDEKRDVHISHKIVSRSVDAHYVPVYCMHFECGEKSADIMMSANGKAFSELADFNALQTEYDRLFGENAQQPTPQEEMVEEGEITAQESVDEEKQKPSFKKELIIGGIGVGLLLLALLIGAIIG